MKLRIRMPGRQVAIIQMPSIAFYHTFAASPNASDNDTSLDSSASLICVKMAQSTYIKPIESLAYDVNVLSPLPPLPQLASDGPPNLERYSALR